ncbi:hypothetical protein SAY86_020882 [Trapa natans]|uniref:Methyltransferase n=1 Tax=Trapa natans TaxID=22666 RepID=A0AAN7MRH5_TRANT|nr:hypothetical protein SAY86_020882 [Trapa natans]
MKYVLLEMDRILRPNGYAIIRESSYLIDAISSTAKGMRWGCRKDNTEENLEESVLFKLYIMRKDATMSTVCHIYISNVYVERQVQNFLKPSKELDPMEVQGTTYFLSLLPHRDCRKRSPFFLASFQSELSS